LTRPLTVPLRNIRIPTVKSSVIAAWSVWSYAM
jgi:hypothetical protein